MIDMALALRTIRQLALSSTQDELDAARMEAMDALDQAGWERSARAVAEAIGLPVAGAERAAAAPGTTGSD